ncbi:PREDICTED: structural maintenance of chromosomes protein 1A-like [Trachymyrmex cornetzi]|uniref:structural maintenance of chromosomes protein 1A-like n=1 Tax=Trachymyrmex cornetzi TaxID=471704 RepID=UPI00084F59AD|nr:PREDICTED: structural maintenance of chromosomes protein 1A-like [Trachymyrmex cornetzi]
MGLDIKAENFLLPQDYIACFAMKKPKDLTAMFEKIANSNEYKADYDRLKLELLDVAEKINFEDKLKKQILIQKKYAIMEKAETEKYLKLKEQYRRVEFLQDKERKIKLRIDEYLHNKKNVIILLEDTKSQFKFSSSSLEDIEQDILKMKNTIEQRKTEHIIFKDNILYWQKKRESARIALDSANKARDTNKRIIQELNNELERINNELTELRKASQTTTIEFSNSQVKRYMELTNKVEFRAHNSIKQIKSLMHDQQEDQAKLDNEYRRKEELEDKEKQIILKKVNLETRFTRLQDSSIKSKTTLMEKTAKIQELDKKITETRNKLLNLENDIVKITEELSEADIDKNSILHRNKKIETINMLKQIYSGVYGRLLDLCKPIHSRYNVAVTKVFGQYINAIVVDTTRTAIQCIQLLKREKIGIETFLPLDSIKNIILNERLRAIEEPQNVKLLYDVLNISSPHINNAVLSVTKNTLVCETSEHAKMLAYPDDKQEAHDCVSLDGCFYRKKGLMSGGLADLTVKAKQWDEQRILTLMEQKRRVEFLQDKEKKIKLRIDEYLHNKKNLIILLEDTKSQFKFLSSSLEDIEQDILKMKNTIEQRKTEHIIFKDNILYWQKKRESARIALDSANKARDTNKRIIQELNNELERINNELTELRKASQTTTIEFSNSQVKRYMELTNKVEFRAHNSIKQIKSLMHDQQEDQAKLDNEYRRKEELEDKEKQIILKKVNLETRFTRLQDSSIKSKTTLMEKTAKIQELDKKITETRNKLLNLENDIVKITEELSEADIDKNSILHRNKKIETINMLKQIYSGVYGRLLDLCKPIHSRYNVAVTKVFGQYINAIVVDTTRTAIQCIQLLKREKIGIETFLPLDSIKNIILNERLRAIEEPQNVKLLYDVLNISSPHINNAVLSVTKNTLVCETSEHAKMLAYPDDKQEAHDCVSLDGCFYRKKGLMSGGLADLTVKAKQWDEQRILTLMEQKNYILERCQLFFPIFCHVLLMEGVTTLVEPNKVLKWQQAVECANTEWNKVCQQERHAKIKVEREETKMSKLKDNYTNVAKDLEDVTKKLAEHKSQISVNEKLYLEDQKAHIAMEDISIPMSETHSRLEENVFTSSSNLSIELSGDCEILTKINFSQFPKEICNFTNEKLRDMTLQLTEKITKIENEFDDLVNLKIDEKIDIIKQRMQKINTDLRNYRNKYNEIKMQFESVKAKRYKSFSDCLERVTAEIDLIYKNLVNNTSAQAIILPDNPEEPYAGNIIYNCIAPHKGFQPLQYLSDGEKSMASLALLFAIQRYKQIPFFIMDEGDAALDKVNIKNVVSFIRSQETLMQFIMISLHKELYRNSNALVGVTVKSDISCSNSQVFAISLNGYRKSK